MPSLKECPAQLINIKDQIDIGKYESQILDTEREFRLEILKLDDTKSIIINLLNFLNNYPNFDIKYIDLSNNKIKSTLEVLDDDDKKYIPDFKNTIEYKLLSFILCFYIVIIFNIIFNRLL
jgi:hypothetical protein